jgi:hypothetical protein
MFGSTDAVVVGDKKREGKRLCFSYHCFCVISFVMLIYHITDPSRDTAYRNVSLEYNGDNRSSSQGWWSLTETCSDENYENFLKKIDYDHCSKLVMYTFNDKSFPKTLSFISGEG